MHGDTLLISFMPYASHCPDAVRPAWDGYYEAVMFLNVSLLHKVCANRLMHLMPKLALQKKFHCLLPLSQNIGSYGRK